MPAFSKSIFTTAISIRPQYRNRHRLMRALIERLDPRIAVLNTHAGSPAQTMRLQNVHFTQNDLLGWIITVDLALRAVDTSVGE